MANLSVAFDVLTKNADQAARDMDRVGNSSERTGHKVEKVGGSMRLLGSTFVGASNQALGPLQEIANKFDLIEQASANASSKAGGRLLGLGAAGLGAGAFLSTLASREEAGRKQLQAAIEATGHAYEDFAPQAEKAATASEHFGYQASQTLDALNRLTLTTHNPAEAMKDLSVAIDVAAAKHIGLSKAAELVGLTFNGSTRAGKQFGLQLENAAGAAKTLAAAQTASKTANEHVTAAQQSYNDKLAIYNQTLKPTLAQQIALYRSHQAVAGAQDAAAAAAGRLKVAQDKAKDAAGAGARNVQKLADITKGQGAAAADTFAGHLRALGARIEDTAGKFGEKFGGAISTVSLGTIAVGTLLEAGLGAKLAGLATRLGLTGTAFKTLAATEVATSAEGAAAVEAAAGTEVLALEGVGAAGIEAGVEVGAGFTAMLGPIALATGAVFGLIELMKWMDSHPEVLANLKAGNPTATIDIPAKRNPVLNYKGHSFLNDGSGTSLDSPYLAGGLPAPGDDHGAHRADPSPYAQKGLPAPGDDRGAHRGPLTKVTDPSLQAFLDSIGAGKAANAQLAAAAADAAKAAKQAAVDSATAIRDSIKGQFDAAKSVLTEAVSQAKQLRESISGSLIRGAQITDVFGTGPNLNANHAFGSGQDFASVKRFFEDRLTKLKRFAAELSALVHKGLDPATVAQIAQAGLDSGGRLADALSGASKGQIGELNSLTGQIGTVADSAGKRISDVQFKAQIAADKKNTDILGKKLDEANRHLRLISREKPGGAVDQRAAAFLAGA